MPFTLKVEFAGLCLHLDQKDGRRVGVVMPDCRKVVGNTMEHEDGTPGVPHVGYLRFDLANLVQGIPPGTVQDGPQYEVIHRLNHQEVNFNLPAAVGVVEGEVELPRLDEIANEPSSSTPVPLLEPLPGLFSPEPGEAPLLMRTIVEGGRLTAEGKEFWEFPQTLRRGTNTTYVDDFRSVATWTRHVETEDALTITISDFNGRNTVTIRLRPATPDGVIPIKLANLCAENPLEWNEFEPRVITGNDVDFKWLFRLLRPTKNRTYRELLTNASGKLEEFPVPRRAQGGGLGRQDCFGGVLPVDTLT